MCEVLCMQNTIENPHEKDKLVWKMSPLILTQVCDNLSKKKKKKKPV